MITFETTDPAALLNKIKAGIDSGHIVTWSYDSNGDFTHSVPQWKYQAWVRPSIAASALTFVIVGRSDVRLSVETYAIYHGRFLEMMLAHFDKSFTTADSTALASVSDLIAA
ncbi:hypothetical protein [Granulicella sp. S156]|uniref:hypothetical protein n=1 Tax=Granulicella sp. S156 TaxID=1747224 RepID=UPI00131A6DA6|nr:hypothetical protein [Granulicella sp. S156]